MPKGGSEFLELSESSDASGHAVRWFGRVCICDSEISPTMIASQGIPYLFEYIPDDRTSCSINGYAMDLVATAPRNIFIETTLAQVEGLRDS